MEFITVPAVARMHKVAEGTVRVWHARGRLIPAVRLGDGTRLYNVVDVEAFLESRKEDARRNRATINQSIA